MREDRLNYLFEEVYVFYVKNNIIVPANMDDLYQSQS